ncbi:staphylopine uptake ABC transporter ATP-binding protein CntD [Metabacillus idriensis]|uniref:staphylopine uptake ABC transporter ATP-binding protein CntD n=1 Tax=Metabacillus idriensis TaxID=324768 RepID=UPI003D2752F0
MTKLLEVKDLTIRDSGDDRTIVECSTFALEKGRCLAIVGESGSGKSVTCRALMRLNKPHLHQSGEIRLNGEDLMSLTNREMRKKRGKNLCMILQNGMSAFDPTCVIGVHLYETLHEHYGWSKRVIEDKVKYAMERVNLKNPGELLKKYPHQLSGGMLQRMMIALALVLEPDIIIADEPTTALDTISQYEVIEQFSRLRERMGCSLIFVSHDLGAVRKIADDVMIMKDGKIVEMGEKEIIFSSPQHPYTKYLVSTRYSLSNHFKKLMGEEL